MSSFRLAPPERLTSSRTLAVLLPARALASFLRDFADVAPLFAFFARLALWPDLALDGATSAACAATRGFFGCFGCSTGAAAGALAVSTGMPFIFRFLLGR